MVDRFSFPVIESIRPLRGREAKALLPGLSWVGQIDQQTGRSGTSYQRSYLELRWVMVRAEFQAVRARDPQPL